MANPLLRLSKKARLCIAIGIAFCFFVAEVSVGFYTHSLALIADAFHVLFDLLSFSLALAAIRVCLPTRRFWYEFIITLDVGFRDRRRSVQKFVVRLATCSTVGFILQWRIPTSAGVQHFLALRGALHLHSKYDFLDASLHMNTTPQLPDS
jgi:hypothetical protein